MTPVRVLQVMPAMDAGGMETFVMNIYRTIDRDKVQFDFLYHYDKPCFFDREITALGGRITKLTVRQDNSVPRYLSALDRLFLEHPEYKILHGHYSGFGMFYNAAAKRRGVPVRVRPQFAEVLRASEEQDRLAEDLMRRAADRAPA